jgi:AraC family transcriptional regulator
MTRAAANQIAATLAAVDIERIGGVVGNSLDGIADSLRRQSPIRWLHMRRQEAERFAEGSIGVSALAVPSHPTRAESIVNEEPEWRVLPQSCARAVSAPRVIASRWRASSQQTLEFAAETTADCHVVKIVLRTMKICFSMSGRTVQDGVTTPGTVHVTEPTVPVRCLFRGPYDVLHLYIPNTLIAEYARDMPGHHAPVLCSHAVPRKDMMIDSLGRALLEANRLGGGFGQTYAEGISMAIVARLLASANNVAASERARASKLAPWRLKRALEYVETRLDEPVSLAEVASSAGLTRMHFAAQFRAATGLRPHEYLLRRRIERAQEMLVVTGMSLVDVALSVGFQTQSHFTSVFKRYAGQPPRAWRASHSVQRA